MKLFITFICLIFTHSINGCEKSSSFQTITFVANSETIGNGFDETTMDYMDGTQYPHLSLILPYFDKSIQTIEVVDWQDDSIDWTAKEKLILGPVWGYTRKIDPFMRWLNSLEQKQVKITNNIHYLKWNVNKHYLLDLKKGHIKVPHTLIIEPESKLTFDEAKVLFENQFGSSDIILKGVIDAGAFGYKHVDLRNLAEARTHFEQLKSKNAGAIIQKFIPQIYQKGEFAFVFFDGIINFFFLRVPAYNDERVQDFYGGRSFHFKKDAIDAQIEFIKSDFRTDLTLTEKDVINAFIQAEAIYKKHLSVLDHLNIEHPKYLRIDGVMVDDHFVVMELEGVEPYLQMKEAMENDPTNDVVKNYFDCLFKN